jgi:hypothetical protein
MMHMPPLAHAMPTHGSHVEQGLVSMSAGQSAPPVHSCRSRSKPDARACSTGRARVSAPAPHESAGAAL